MGKLGISVKIDVTKIDKTRLFNGEKGVYLELTTFIDVDQQDQYGNNGFISQSISKEERQMGNVQTPILGNVKVFYKDDQQLVPNHEPQGYNQQNQQGFQRPADNGVAPAMGGANTQNQEFEDDLPF